MGAFNSSGCMSHTLLTFLTAKSVADIRNSQAQNSIFNDRRERISDDVLLTLAGIKALNQHFGQNRKIWMLVERKARKFILSQGRLDKDTLENALDSLVITVVSVIE